ncbi:hypothetical protein K1719_011121 [Acacia pycnantha]|nr:hypothetical protein K1719_011121 [Acacia pycnantha]
MEKVVAFHPVMSPWQSAVRDGLLQSGVVPYNGFAYNHINGTKVGGTIFDPDGHRHTAADLLLMPIPLKSPYSSTPPSTRSSSLIHPKSKATVARGVIFRDSRGAKHKAYLKNGPKNEIIVSAGALGSPQLLMLSGIGPKAYLKAHNITMVLDQPFVGKGMSDNPMNQYNPMNSVFVPSPIRVDISLLSIVGITSFGAFIESASGENFAAGSPKDYGMFSPNIGQLSKLPPKQRTPEALVKATELMESLDGVAFQGGFIFEKIMGLISIGHLKLRNRNPNENPSVTFNYFQDLRDLERCVEGISTIEKVGKVVDRHYKVKGVNRLRVIDGSTFLSSPGTNPQATVMMLGRYMGVKMLRERLAGE